MADKRDDSDQTGKIAQAPQRRTASGAAQDQSSGGDRAAGEKPGSSTGVDEKPPASVARRKQRYLIGLRSLPGLNASSADPFLERLALMDGVEIVRRLRPRGPQALAAANGSPASEIIVARIDEQRGEALRQGAPPHVIVEVDARLGYFDMAAPEPIGWQLGARALPFPRPRRDIRFRILGDGDRPLANAGVYLYGPGFPAQAITDSSGLATLQTFSVDGAGILAVYVRPASDHWERYVQNPLLDAGNINTIRLSPLGRVPAKFPGERPHSWGQRMMRFDRISADWSGTGIKIGLIDSGCDTSHPSLRQVAQGVDFTRDVDAQSWTADEIGYGTHCAGIVAGTASSASGMIGCAPGAELHVLKVVPGGYFSDLIEALDQCIERRLDLVQIGVSGQRYSELVAQKINEARLNGIACIVGAGNSGGSVQFPAMYPVCCPSRPSVSSASVRWIHGMRRVRLRSRWDSRACSPRISALGGRRSACAPRVSQSSPAFRAADMRRGTAPPWPPRTSPDSRPCCSRIIRYCKASATLALSNSGWRSCSTSFGALRYPICTRIQTGSAPDCRIWNRCRPHRPISHSWQASQSHPRRARCSGQVWLRARCPTRSVQSCGCVRIAPGLDESPATIHSAAANCSLMSERSFATACPRRCTFNLPRMLRT